MLNLYDYLDKKLDIAQGKAVQDFEPNKYAEDGIEVLKLLTMALDKIQELNREKEMLKYDVAAEKRNVQYLKGLS